MATTIISSGGVSSPAESAALFGNTTAVGVTAGGVSSTFATNGSNAYGYTLVVQIPLPTLKLDLDKLGNFALSKLSIPKIPKAVQTFVTQGEAEFQHVVDVATKLIRAIPTMSVTILVKLGQVTVLNVQLVAVKTPVVVPVPKFALALPNIAIDANLDLTSLIPVPPPIVIGVPVPYPVIPALFPLTGVTGGNVSAGASVTSPVASAAVGGTVTPETIASAVRLPVI